ncbi:MAG: PAS domain S-box protein [Lysobacterales bacterium]|nr:MAG: PAS domain S-box protein [Xanthomonadales bacterium]
MDNATRANGMSVDNYRTLIDASPQALLVHRNLVPRYANRALATLFGYEDEKAVLRVASTLELAHPVEHERLRALASARVSGELPPQRYEMRCRRRDGTFFWVEVISSAVSWDGEPVVQAGIVDISWRRIAEEQLRESRKLLRTVIETLPMFVFVKDLDSNYIMANKAMTDFYGSDQEDFATMTPISLPIQSEEEKQMILGDDRVVFETRQPYIQPVVPVTKPDGTQTFRYSIKIPLFSDNGELTGLLGVGEDITERKRVEKDLQRVYDELEQRVEERTAALRQSEAALTARQGELRKLAGNLLMAQESERRSFARELHDDLTQRLAILALDVDALGREHSEVPVSMREQLRGLQGRIADIASDAQGMARRLHPSILDDLGLVKALKAECAHFSNREGIQVAFEHRDVPATLPRTLSLCLYRIAQESLRNISKHAASPDAVVDLFAAGKGQICLSVQDHGGGFCMAKADGKGLGLVSMRERARLAGGTCSVSSELGEGTRVDVRLPVAGVAE